MGREDAPLENAQEIALLFATAVFAIAAKRLKDAPRMAALGSCFLGIVFYLRELELPVTGPVTAYLDSNAFRWHEAVVLALILIPYVLLQRRFLAAQWRYIRSGRGWPYLVAAMWLLIGDALDKIVPGPAGGFVEEWAELNGYLTLLHVAYAFSQQGKSESITAS